jgi:hypothetical protein
MTNASVSRSVNRIDPPDKQILRLFRIILAGENDEHVALREVAPSGDLEIWRRRKGGREGIGRIESRATRIVKITVNIGQPIPKYATVAYFGS